MTIVNFTPWSALAGGALIGLAAAGTWWLLGHLAGVSSILGTAMISRREDFAWRAAFIAGLFLAGIAVVFVFPDKAHFRLEAGYGQVVLAGALVGLGTQMGSGCTSGHGVCGVSRLSPRSIAATLLFMGAGIVTVYFWVHQS
ncbi:MAG TPA: YeeE/YedE thiosulfate transporter family protein [Burkholderiales bacterium]|nr:YeeE/YedE thiosulfate transporter family protein [Burkholderiales bacterium]